MGVAGSDLVLLAHPLTDSVVLPLPPLAIGGLAAIVVVTAASFGPLIERNGADLLTRTRGGPLGPVDLVGRALPIALVAAAVVAGRTGTASTTRNVAPILLVVVGWPVLVAATAAFGSLWPRIDPFDGLARLVGAPEGDPAADGAPAAVWAAVPLMLLISGCVVAFPETIRPRSLSLIVAVYVLLTVGGCLALGRRSWLERVEPVGLLLTWIGGMRRRRLVAWAPPGGAAAMLGVTAGVTLYGLLRGTALYVDVAFTVGPGALDILGPVALALLSSLVIAAGDRGARDRTATAAAVPVVVGLLLAYALRQGRLLVGLQLLPGLLVDPLGRGWTVAGLGQSAVSPLPISAATLALLQVGLVVAGGVAGARIVRHRSVGRGGGGPVMAVVLLVAAGIVAVTVA